MCRLQHSLGACEVSFQVPFRVSVPLHFVSLAQAYTHSLSGPASLLF